MSVDQGCAVQPALNPDYLTGMNLILHTEHTAMQNVIEVWIEGLNVKPRVVIKMKNIEAIKSLVRAGLGSSILPLCAATRSGAADPSWTTRVKGCPLHREPSLISADAEILPNSISELAALITSTWVEN